MKRIFGIAVLSILLLAGCKQTSNSVAGIFEPIIGTWNATVLGVPTELIFNADETCTENTTVLDIVITKNGTWDADETKITREFSDGTSDTLYYTFNSDASEMTVSSSPDGISVTYEED